MYFITFTDMWGSQGDKIAAGVAKALNYPFYGEEELLKTAEEMGYLSDVLKLGEKGPHLMEKIFSEKPKVYLDRLQSVIYEVAKKGDAVFFGKGSQLLLHSFDCALHVLVTGSTKKRTERVMEAGKVEKEIAEKMIHRSDSDKKGFLRFAFDEDWLNPHLYDLILNTDKLSVDSAVKMVVDAAKSEEIKTCGIDSVNSLKRLSLHRQIESIFLEKGLSTPQFFFQVEDTDSVRLFGVSNSEEEKQKIETLVKGIKDIKKVTNDLIIVKPFMGGV